jgi:hypothetical protein
VGAQNPPIIEAGVRSQGGWVRFATGGPTASFGDDGPVDEGSSFTLSLSDADDVSSVDVAAGFEYAFDCGEGYGEFGGEASAQCPTSDDGERQVGAKIRDKDGGVREYSGTVTVANVAPTLTAPGQEQEAAEGQDRTFDLGAFSDAGANDGPWTVTVDWGDGSPVTSHTVVGTPWPDGQVHHTYRDAGMVTVTVTDVWDVQFRVVDPVVITDTVRAELAARVASVLRRVGTPAPRGTLRFDGLEIDEVTREVRLGGAPVELVEVAHASPPPGPAASATASAPSVSPADVTIVPTPSSVKISMSTAWRTRPSRMCACGTPPRMASTIECTFGRIPSWSSSAACIRCSSATDTSLMRLSPSRPKSW